MDESTNFRTSAASRRAFLAGAGLAGAAVGTGVFAERADAAPNAAAPNAAAPDARSYTGGRFALELDGLAAGPLSAGDGGNAVGVVLDDNDGAPENVVHKHIAGVKYEDISVSCGTGMSKPFYEWIQASLNGKDPGHSGRLTTWESDGTQPDARTFTNALISEIEFPALDAASKDAAKMTITFQPETTARGKAGPRQTIGAKQKLFFAANFRLKIDNTDCSRVATIDSFTWKVTIEDDGKGLEATKLEIPNLVITTPASHAKEFYDWHEDFVLNGNSKDERKGELTVLTPDLKHTLFTLTFAGLGIWIVDSLPPTADKIRRVKAEMYCEQISFKFGSAAWV